MKHLLTFLIILYQRIKYCFDFVIKRIWLVEIKLRWNKLWIRKNKFHKSLDLDSETMKYMTKHGQVKYIDDLVRRRNIAHERDLNQI